MHVLHSNYRPPTNIHMAAWPIFFCWLLKSRPTGSMKPESNWCCLKGARPSRDNRQLFTCKFVHFNTWSQPLEQVPDTVNGVTLYICTFGSIIYPTPGICMHYIHIYIHVQCTCRAHLHVHACTLYMYHLFCSVLDLSKVSARKKLIYCMSGFNCQ